VLFITGARRFVKRQIFPISHLSHLSPTLTFDQGYVKLNQSFLLSSEAVLITGQIPYGVGDLFLEDAVQQRALEMDLRRTFAGWAYSEIIPPTLEYADVVAGPAGRQLAGNMIRFVDRDGQTLALRPDLTIPTARAVGTKLYDEPLPLRLFYIGNVFRYEEPQAGRRREFSQAGFELIGAGTVAADVEVLSLTIAALRAAGLRTFQLTIGHIGFYHGLLTALNLTPEATQILSDAIDRKRQGDLAALLPTLPLTLPARRALQALPHLVGGAAVFTQALEICLTAEMAAAVDHLQAVYTRLAAAGLAPQVTVDLGEIRGMAYYTGITFEGFAPGLGASLCSGGRYDNLIGHFGPPLPAVGCALVVERLRQVARQQQAPLRSQAPDWLVGAAPGADVAALQAWMAAQRAAGQVIDVDLLGRSADTLRALAAQRAIPRLLWLDAESVSLFTAEGQQSWTIADFLAAPQEAL